MTFFSWWRSLVQMANRGFSFSLRRGKAKARRTARPIHRRFSFDFEMLENRLVPTAQPALNIQVGNGAEVPGGNFFLLPVYVSGTNSINFGNIPGLGNFGGGNVDIVYDQTQLSLVGVVDGTSPLDTILGDINNAGEGLSTMAFSPLKISPSPLNPTNPDTLTYPGGDTGTGGQGWFTVGFSNGFNGLQNYGLGSYTLFYLEFQVAPGATSGTTTSVSVANNPPSNQGSASATNFGLQNQTVVNGTTFQPYLVNGGGVISNVLQNSSGLVTILNAPADGTTQTQVNSINNPSGFDNPMVFTATVYGESSDGLGSPPDGTVTFFDGGTSIGQGTLLTTSFNNGAPPALYASATLPFTFLTQGTHTITAQYNGDGSALFSASTSANYLQVVDAGIPTVSLAATPAASTLTTTTAITFSATVTPSNSNGPTGTVIFTDNGTSIGQGTINGSHVATFSTAGLSKGSQTIVANYQGDTNFQGSAVNGTSGSLVDVVLLSDTVIETSTQNPSDYLQAFTLNATITVGGGNPTPTGTVTFKDGATQLATATLNASGVASFTPTAAQLAGSLKPRTHSFAANYGGDTNYISNSASISQIVNKAATSSTVTSSQNPDTSSLATAISFTATITATASGTSTLASGSVTFESGGTPLTGGTVAVSSTNNKATFSITGTALGGLGSYSITAVYNGDSNFSASTLATLTQVVGAAKLSSTTTLTSDAATTAFDTVVTFTATVSPSTGGTIASGTVTFEDGATSIGQAALSGTNPDTATFSTTSLSVTASPHTISATYNGDTNFAGGTSNSLTQAVTKNTSATSLTSNTTSSPFNTVVNFTATVTSAGTLASGTVTFDDGATSIGAGVITTGVATFSTTNLSVTASPHTISATYNGDSNFSAAPTSNSLTQAVTKNTSSTSLTSSAATTAINQHVTFTATVTSSGTLASGTVTFDDGGSSLGTGTISAGVATFSTSFVSAPSTHTMTAVYNGDSNFSASPASNTLTQVVTSIQETTSLTSSTPTSTFGGNVVFTATVTGSNGTATGTVTFEDGGVPIGGGVVVLSGGVASFTDSSLSVTASPHTITATYSGDTNYAAQNFNSLTQVVLKESNSSSLTSSAPTTAFNTVVSFTATLSASFQKPTGNVTFDDGATSIGTGAFSSGVATFTTTILSVTASPHTISAVYNGDSNFSGSTSNSLAQVVTKNTSSASLTSTAATTAFNAVVTFTATVTSSGTLASGLVTFEDGGAAIGTNPIVGGKATFSTTTLSVTASPHTISAVYNGDSNFSGATSNSLAQVVTKNTSSASLTSNATTTGFNTVVSFTATVTSSGTLASGLVTFEDGGAPIGTNPIVAGVATFSTSTLSVTASPHTISAVYNGDANFSGTTSNSLAQVVTKNTSSASLTSSASTTAFNNIVTFTATVTSSGTLASGLVTFEDGGAPIGTNPIVAGVATFSTTTLSVTASPHTISAVYNGDANFSGTTSNSLAQVVTKNTSSASLTSTATTTAYNTVVTFTATVTSSGTLASGLVTFEDGGAPIGTNPIVGGKATFSTTTLSVTASPHTISAVYNGDANFSGTTSNSLAQVVTKNTSSASLTSSAATTGFNAGVTFTATVTSSGTLASGLVTFEDGGAPIGTNPIVAGVATFSTTTLSVTASPHTISAVYNGDANFSGATSNSLAQVVTKSTSSASLTSTAATTAFNTGVTFTATVTSNGTLASGLVTFEDGGVPIGTNPIVGGVATFSTTTLSVTASPHTISAVYNGDANFSGTTSNSLAQVVTKNTSSASLTSTASTTAFNTGVTFTATVTSSGTLASGLVTFEDGGAAIGTNPIVGGKATFSTTTLSVTASPHTISAVYNGDANFSGTTSNSLAQVVTKNTSSASLTSSSSTTAFNSGVTFTATVTSSGTLASGQVTFDDGATSIGQGAIGAGGVATFSTTTLSVTASPHTISAVYNGDANFSGATSNSLTQAVTQLSSTTSLTSTAATTSINAVVTFSATVTSAGTLASGNVTFDDGGTSIGQGGVGAGGVATFSTSFPAVGTHTISAVYSGDSNFTGSTSNSLTQVVVNGFSSTTSLTSSSSRTTNFNSSVSFTAQVSGSQGTATGTVTFEDNGTPIAGGQQVLSGGTASFATTALPGGTDTITAVYSGDSNYTGSTSNSLTQVVNKVGSATSLTSTAPTTAVSNVVTFSATVTSAGTLASGSVTFDDGGSSVGMGAIGAGGVATFSTSFGAVGTHTISAVYNGDSNFTGSTSNSVTEVVTKSTSSTSLTSSAAVTAFGAPVTFTATVSSSGTLASGSVTFDDGATSIGQGAIGAGGVATFSTTTLSVTASPHTISAVYNGDSNFAGSTSNSLTHAVTRNTSSTSLTSNSASSLFDVPVSFTATVTSVGTLASGTVTFEDGGASIGQGAIGAGGVATFSTSTLSVTASPHTISAVYNGDSNFSGSTSNSLTQTVTKAGTGTSLASSSATTAFGGSVTFTATVTSTGTLASGTVTFDDGATSIGTGAIGAGGVATFSTSTLSVTASPHTISAVYQGDSNFSGSTSNSLTQVVVPTLGPLAAPMSSLNPSNLGQTVTFTATVSPAAPGSPQVTGTVTFFDNGSSIGTGALSPVGTLGSAQATFSTSALSVGTRSITFTYSGDSHYASAGPSPALSQVVVAAGNNDLMVQRSGQTINQFHPQDMAQTVSVTNLGASEPGRFDFSFSGIPSGTTLGQVQVKVGSGGVYTLTASELAAAIDYTNAASGVIKLNLPITATPSGLASGSTMQVFLTWVAPAGTTWSTAATDAMHTKTFTLGVDSVSGGN